jgi:hypothetical protein
MLRRFSEKRTHIPGGIMESLISALKSIKGAKFARFKYNARGTGEVSNYLTNLGVNVEKVYRDDLKTIEGLIPTLEGVKLEAAIELRDSIRASLEKGIGENPMYTGADTYFSLPNVPGVKVHKETGDLHLVCMVERKEVIVPGTYKEVKSRPKTIAKKELEKSLRRSRIRQFALSNVKIAALQGEVLVFE